MIFRNNASQDVYNVYQAPESSGDKSIETLFSIINEYEKQEKDKSENSYHNAKSTWKL